MDDHMKRDNLYRFDKRDEKIIQVFADLGMPKNFAKTLIYISSTDECRSAEIEHGARLRQPEVSVAMQHLQNRGWIERRDIRKKGKGRPVHLYKLTTSLEGVLKNFEEEKTQQIGAIKKDLSELKSLVEKR